MKRCPSYMSSLAGLLVFATTGAGLFAQNDVEREKPAGYVAGQPGRMLIQRAGSFGPAHGQTFEFISAGYEFAGEVVKDAPYSAEAVTESVQTLSDGNRIVRKNKVKLYRDSQGRTRREQTLTSVGPWAAAGEPQEIIFINDPVEKVQYVLNPKDRTARRMTPPTFERVGKMEALEGNYTAEVKAGASPAVDVHRFGWFDREDGTRLEGHDVTMAVPPHHQQQMSQPPVTESLGTRAIEGVQAQGIRTTITIAAGEIGNERPIEIVSERWESPELKVQVMTTRSDPRFGETVYRLSNIQRVEPLASLFEVPPGYTLEEGHSFKARRLNEIKGATNDGGPQ